MVMLGVMMVISQILVMENIPSTVLALMSSVSENPKVILLLINIFLVLMGMIMDCLLYTSRCV